MTRGASQRGMKSTSAQRLLQENPVNIRAAAVQFQAGAAHSESCERHIYIQRPLKTKKTCHLTGAAL